MNRSFEKAAGLARERILGKTSADLVGDPVVSAQLSANDRRALSAETPLTFEEVVPRPEGERAFISVRCALRGPDGAIYGLCGISTDITELKRAEAERVRLETFLDSIVENIPNMVFVKDAREPRFVHFNRAGEELVGFSRTELVGKNDYDFFPREEADFFTSKDREVLARRERLDIPEEPIRTRGGETRYLHTQKVPILDAEGNPQYLLGISEDVTERKRVEERLAILNEGLRRRTEELEASNQELEAFSYSVSHDLRTPLRHIAGFADLLERGAGDTLDEKSLRYLDKIARSATRMGELIDDLLVFSRMARAEMRYGPVELSPLVEEIVEEIREETRDRTIEWRIGALPQVDRRPGDAASGAGQPDLQRGQVHAPSAGGPHRDRRRAPERQCRGVRARQRHGLRGPVPSQAVRRLPAASSAGGVRGHRDRARERAPHRPPPWRHDWAEGEKDHGACFYFSLPEFGKDAA